MANKPKAVKSNVNIDLLKNIDATNNSGSVFYISKDDGLPLLNHDPALIEVNMEMVDGNGNAAARLTDAGKALIAAAPATNAAAPQADKASAFEIITNAGLPPSRRGGRRRGAPSKYPFDKLEIGRSFFVPKSADHPDPVKTLGSTVSSANLRYAKETGETKEVERAVRDGRKAKLDANGNKIMEKKIVPVYNYERQFSIRGVEKGKTYGSWVAPDDGALITRVK